MEKTPFKVYLSVVSAMVFWSLTFIFFKIANKTYPPFTIVFLRLFISSVILLVIAFFSGHLQKIRKKDLKWFIVIALVNPFLYFLAESIGLTLISASLTGVIIATIPLFVPIGAFMFFRERLTTLNIIGFIISFLGVLVVILNKGFAFQASPLGILLIFLAVLFAVAYTLLVRRMIHHYNAYTITSYQNIVGTFLFLPLVLIFEFNEISTADHSIRAFSSIFYLAVFGSSLAFILFNYSIKILGAAKTDAFTNIIPVLTAFFAYLILGEAISLQMITGIAIVLTGLFLSQIGQGFTLKKNKRQWEI